MSNIIDGKAISVQLKDEIKDQIEALKSKGKEINLSIILVGDDPASKVYLRSKVKACENAGIGVKTHELPETTGTAELKDLVKSLSEDKACDAIFIEHPLPKHIDRNEVLKALDPKKDVDGIHPVNIGALASGEKGFVPCTPAGVMKLLERSGISIKGKTCVVVGGSNIVGKPMGLLLLAGRGAVTICRSAAKDLPGICRTADILVAAVGSPRMINKDYIKPGAVVIDVGINDDPNGNGICGDVDFDDVSDLCSAITPVPGGVGPMTVVMLMENILEAAKGNME